MAFASQNCEHPPYFGEVRSTDRFGKFKTLIRRIRCVTCHSSPGAPCERPRNGIRSQISHPICNRQGRLLRIPERPRASGGVAGLLSAVGSSPHPSPILGKGTGAEPGTKRLESRKTASATLTPPSSLTSPASRQPSGVAPGTKRLTAGKPHPQH